jgi:hypothetical protein
MNEDVHDQGKQRERTGKLTDDPNCGGLIGRGIEGDGPQVTP